MTTKGNLSKAAKYLGKVSLKIPFEQFRICKILQRTLDIASSAAVAESNHQF